MILVLKLGQLENLCHVTFDVIDLGLDASISKHLARGNDGIRNDRPACENRLYR